ncbi:TetR family transcriptional regulator [Rhodococcus sp. OK519]|uniref:TetR/AcrR family transcriptional regulator n=1 Tax=Rhodococcus sp. OK519 TaxID=2135729 RepID=UPI000D3571F9|nr:TetR family transcriptional regulator [Rhodococcus sp. OK519]
MNSPNGRQALIDSAERLVAERGLHGVSAREVMRAAGQRNHGAIVYYFGSWDGLLRTVWTERTATVDLQTELIHAAVESDDRLAALAWAYVHPFVAEVAARTPSYWARFNEQWLTGIRADFVDTPDPLVPNDPSYPRIAGLEPLQALFGLIADEMTHLDPPNRAARVALAARFVVSALAAWERDFIGGVWRDLSTYETELTALTVSLLRTP